MKETSKQNLAILFITILVTGAIFVFIRFVQPSINELKELAVKIAEEKEKIILIKEYKAKSESLIQAYASLGDQIDDVNLALPDNSQAAQLLAVFDAISEKTGISLSYLSFNEGVQDEQGFLDIKTSFFAKYEDFKKWVEEIEKELRLIDLTKVGIENSKDSKKPLTKYDIEMRAYFVANE